MLLSLHVFHFSLMFFEPIKRCTANAWQHKHGSTCMTAHAWQHMHGSPSATLSPSCPPSTSPTVLRLRGLSHWRRSIINKKSNLKLVIAHSEHKAQHRGDGKRNKQREEQIFFLLPSYKQSFLSQQKHSWESNISILFRQICEKKLFSLLYSVHLLLGNTPTMASASVHA